MLRHRANVMRLEEVNVNGYVAHKWVLRKKNVPVFLDLNFIRKGKDPLWSPEAGRRSDRTGVLFALESGDVRSGDRVVMTKGPKGAFQVEGAVDDAWRPTSLHHIEVGVVEVSDALFSGESS